MVMASVRLPEFPQAFVAFTESVPPEEPQRRVRFGVPCPPRIVAPPGIAQVYPDAPRDPAVEYDSTEPTQTFGLPLMGPGSVGFADTTSVRVPLLPHEFVETTE